MLLTVFGRRGSGKTTAIRAAIPKLKEPVVIVDLLGNFDPELKPNSPDWIKVKGSAPAVAEIKKYIENPDEHPGVISVEVAQGAETVDFIAAALWDVHGGTLVLDEADFVSLAEAPAFDDLIRYGRNRGVDIIIGCRRPAEISKNITAGADRILCFTTHEPRDVDYFKKLFGDEFAETLPNLERYHGIFIDYLKETRGTFKTDKKGRVHILTESTIHSRPTPLETDQTQVK